MSIPKQILRGLIFGLVLVGLILLGLYLARLPKPRPKHVRSTTGTKWMGLYVGDYVEEHGVPPYSSQASVDEYVEELARGIKDGALFLSWMKKDAKYVVFVNLTREEWDAVRAFFETHRSLEHKLRSTDPDAAIIVVGWQAIPAPDGDRMIMFMSGGAWPGFADTFRWEVRHLDRAIRASLGKSLVDCLLCEYKHFDPSTIEFIVEDGGNGETRD